MVRFYLYLCLAIVLVLGAVNKWLNKPFSETKKEIADCSYAPLNTIQEEEDTLSFEYHYRNIQYHFKKPFFQETLTGFIYRDDEGIKEYYRSYSIDHDPVFSDIGHFGFAVIYLEEGFADLAMEKLLEIKQTERSAYYLVKGLIFKNAGMLPEARACFNKEINLKGNKPESIKNLGMVFWAEQNYTSLDSLRQITNLELPPIIHASTDLKTGKFFEYIKIRLPPNFDLIGLVSSFFISLIWFFYVIRLNLFKEKNWTAWLLTFMISVIVTPIALVLYDIYELFFGFTLTGEILNDMLFCIFGIGFIEETIKFIPVLIILYILKPVKEPIDLIILASISALGFAFSENMLYVNESHTEVLRGRALTATVSHMFDSSLVAYGIILSKYRKKGNVILFFFLFLLMASVTHGFYDFWLLNKSVQIFTLITPFFMIVCLLLWVTMVNNALNISPFFSYQKIPDTESIKKYLLTTTVSIVLFQYILNAFIKGAEASNLELSLSVISVGFFIFFYAGNFSYIDIVKDYWAPFSIRKFAWKTEYNKLTGKRIKLQMTGKSSKELFSTISGSVSGRKVIGLDSGFYTFIPETAFEYAGSRIENIILKPSPGFSPDNPEESQVIILTEVNQNASKNTKVLKKISKAKIQLL